MKDYFSGHANVYATFRPTYPQELYDFILARVKLREKAWDCGTGNGQVARILAEYFNGIEATDISAQQLAQAGTAENISYTVSPAEQTRFQDHTFDLVTVAQALHWFNRDAFYREARRTVKPGGVIAVWGYSTLTIAPELDNIIADFYENVVGPYWDDARRLVEEEYRTIEFPFKNVARKKFAIDVDWTPAHLAGYLESWSATQKYMKTYNRNPVPGVMSRLETFWADGDHKRVRFPVFALVGEV